MPEPTPSNDRELGSLDYLKAAFYWQYNLIGLASAAVLAVVAQSPLPLALAAGVELMYLSTVPQLSRFRRLVRSWKFAEEKRRDQVRLQAMFMELPPEMRKRYADLDRTVRAIRINYGRLSSTSRIFVQQIAERLAGLQQSYLGLLQSAHVHRTYLQAANPGAIRNEAEALAKAVDQAPKVREINRRRIEILNKRLERHEKIRENCAVVEAQCGAVEDVLDLIRDQSVTMSDPQQISLQLESLIQDVEHTEETVREVESIFALADPAMAAEIAPAPAPASEASPESQGRTGIRDRTRS